MRYHVVQPNSILLRRTRQVTLPRSVIGEDIAKSLNSSPFARSSITSSSTNAESERLARTAPRGESRRRLGRVGPSATRGVG
jgi:hypothetical protein